MSLRTNVCPVDLRVTAQVRCWKKAKRKMTKAGGVKVSILVGNTWGEMEGRERRTR